MDGDPRPGWLAAAIVARPVAPRARWRALRDVWRDDPSAVFACVQGARVYLLAGDDERVMPSPATSLARYELAERVDQIRGAQALLGPAPVVDVSASLGEVVSALRRAPRRPVLVAGSNPPLVLRAEAVLAWLGARLEGGKRCT